MFNRCPFLHSSSGATQPGCRCRLPSRFVRPRLTATLHRPKDVRETTVPLFKPDAFSLQSRCNHVRFHGHCDFKLRRHEHDTRISQRRRQRTNDWRTAKDGPSDRLGAKRFCQSATGGPKGCDSTDHWKSASRDSGGSFRRVIRTSLRSWSTVVCSYDHFTVYFIAVEGFSWIELVPGEVVWGSACLCVATGKTCVFWYRFDFLLLKSH